MTNEREQSKESEKEKAVCYCKHTYINKERLFKRSLEFFLQQKYFFANLFVRDQLLTELTAARPEVCVQLIDESVASADKGTGAVIYRGPHPYRDALIIKRVKKQYLVLMIFCFLSLISQCSSPML